jgi:acetyltransferase-like isoleucine patch superfamily enzyme
VSEPPSYYRARLGRYARMFERSLHLRYLAANAVCGLLPDFFSGVVRARVYRWAGFDVGADAFIMGNLRLRGASRDFYDNLSIGAAATIADAVTISLDGKVTIGDHVALAPGVVIYTGTHRIGPGSRRLGKVDAMPVTIENGAWIRVGAIIVPGITIGRGAIVAAGAIVLQDVPPNTYVEGNPAKVIRKLGWANR